MSTKGGRPASLPDFKSPPLNEVVVGVQFNQPDAYQQIYAGEVWKLFKRRYPKVSEQLALAPSFETFGLPNRVAPQFGIIQGATHDRFWFLRPGGEELIQFQHDRLLHNWRKVGDGSNPYPRFESMIGRFRSELEKLEEFFKSLGHEALEISQCEVSYINHISPLEDAKRLSDWVHILNFGTNEPDDFTAKFREVIRGENGEPIGRFICEISTGFKPESGRIVVMNLSVKGAPLESNIDAALEFLNMGRHLIVRRFAELTTDEAHVRWERVK